MDLKFPQRTVSYLEQNCNIWVTQFSLNIGQGVSNPWEIGKKQYKNCIPLPLLKVVEVLQEW